MEPLTIALIVLPLLGFASGWVAKRVPSAPEPTDDPRLGIERARADGAEAKVATQQQELRDWAASHRALEEQVGDLQGRLKEAEAGAETGGVEAKERIESLEARITELGDAAGQLEDAEQQITALRAEVVQLEGRIAAGAGAVTKDVAVELAKRDERLAVLGKQLDQAARTIAALERRLDD